MTAYRRTHLSSRTVTPPQPAGLYTVFVRDLLLDAKVGIHAHERELAQRIRINIELDAEMPAAGGRGHIDEVVCYEDLVTRIRAVVTRAHVGLMETLAERILEACFTDSRVAGATVRLEKLDVFEDAESVGIEISRIR